MNSSEEPTLNRWQQLVLIALRTVIGWHFLYEGYFKIVHPQWSAGGYLERATGPFAGIFHQMAQNPPVLRAVDLLNEVGLTAVGLGLMAGLLTRPAALVGMLMLALYYISNPPWIGVLTNPGEGNYLWVDKNLVEFFALLVIAVFDTGKMAGIDLALSEWRKRLGAWRASRRKRIGAPSPQATPKEASSD